MTEFRVATWNVQNLFVAGSGDGPETQSEFTSKIASLAALIDQMEPHVIALQEVGTEPALVALQEALAHPMPHRLLGVPDDRGIRVALLATSPLSDRIDVRPFPTGLLPVQCGDDPVGPEGPRTMNQMGRGALQASVNVGGREIRVISCHLKSKLLTFPGGRFAPRDEDERARYAAYALYRRTAEATTLRAHLTAQLAGEGRSDAVILAGDMNDEVDAATTQILNGPPGSEIGSVGFNRADAGDGERMWNLAPRIPESERFTRVYRGRGELIDHVFASHALVAADRLVSVRTLTALGQPLPSVTDDAAELKGEPGSDHAAVLATFNL